MWSRMADTANAKHGDDPRFYGAKLASAEFFFARLLPRIAGFSASIRAGSEHLYLAREEQF
jgi:hypothetical protein